MEKTQTTDRDENNSIVSGQPSLWFLFWTFFKIGSVAFGGFTALIAVVENIIVRKQKILRSEEMLDGISLAMLLPGPVAVNVVAYVGYRIRGGVGAVVSATAVILPSFFLLLGLSAFYFKYGEIPAVSHAFAGFVPAVTAIVINTAWGMSKKAIQGVVEFCIGFTAGVVLLSVGGFYSTLVIIFGSGMLGLVFFRTMQKREKNSEMKDVPHSRPFQLARFRKNILSALLLAGFMIVFLLPLPSLAADSFSRIFITFSGMSLMLFGGGFVFIPLIQEIVVEGLQWVTQQEFISAIAMGQVTPGPILISAAFIGFKIKGVVGAALATFAIFFPPALLMVNSSQLLEFIKYSTPVQAALKGVRAAVVGMIFAAAVVIGQGVSFHWATLLIFTASMISLTRFKIDIVWIIPLAGLTGLFLY